MRFASFLLRTPNTTHLSLKRKRRAGVKQGSASLALQACVRHSNARDFSFLSLVTFDRIAEVKPRPGGPVFAVFPPRV